MKKIILNLDDETFEYLEVLAFGLNQQVFSDDYKNEALQKGYNKQNPLFLL